MPKALGGAMDIYLRFIKCNGGRFQDGGFNEGGEPATIGKAFLLGFARVYCARLQFPRPEGKTLVATQEGESEEDPAVRYSTNISNHECSLLSTNPVESVLGAWRCAVETDLGTHYGFLSVICPWLLNDTENKDDYYLEPFLDTQRESISAVEGAVTMSCIIHAPIRYCYFEASNGTKISVAPETLSTDLKYVGSGFNAGECGVRFTKLVAGDSGTWSCHVGLVNQTGNKVSSSKSPSKVRLRLLVVK
ncbi:uncharacterized protein LOC119193791 [Manduca sexta]|uniref:uncharacterized protein LOC119193791 n=1 Tax=Manduca sexta TaxID=7130 RepID=UPI00188DCF1B|nr:uncharacterized protein LOC119193791 [Manduca sexta]